MAYEFTNIPAHWSIKKMHEVVKWGSGGTPKATEKAYYENGTIPWLIIGDLNDGIVTESATKITELGLENSSAKIIPTGTLLVAMYGSIGKLGITGIECCTNQAIAYAKRLYGVTTKFMYYYMALIKPELIGMGKGGTQKNISQAVLNSLSVPVPPLEEQKCIVARIEELFSELDNGVETLRKTKQQLAVYRQAVVKSVLDTYCNDVKTTKIGDVCHDVKVGIVIKPTQYYVQSGGVRAFRNANVRRNYIEDDDWAMISLEGHQKNARSEVHAGDVLIARSGVNLGMASAVPEQYDGYNAIDVVIAVPKQELILPRYLAYYTNSPYGISSVKRNQRGVAQGHLNITVYGKLPIMLPEIKVQETIIREIDARLSACDSIEKTVDTALQQAEAMRQSILKKAFEGQL